MKNWWVDLIIEEEVVGTQESTLWIASDMLPCLMTIDKSPNFDHFLYLKKKAQMVKYSFCSDQNRDHEKHTRCTGAQEPNHSVGSSRDSNIEIMCRKRVSLLST